MISKNSLFQLWVGAPGGALLLLRAHYWHTSTPILLHKITSNHIHPPTHDESTKQTTNRETNQWPIYYINRINKRRNVQILL